MIFRRGKIQPHRLCGERFFLNPLSDLMDLGKKKENAPTFDAVRARRNFIFSFDISDNCGVGGGRRREGERQPSQLSSAHKTSDQLYFFFFLKVRREVTILN